MQVHGTRSDSTKGVERADQCHCKPCSLASSAEPTLSPLIILIPDGDGKANVSCTLKKGKKEDSGLCRLVSHSSVPGKVMVKILLKATSSHEKDKNIP